MFPSTPTVRSWCLLLLLTLSLQCVSLANAQSINTPAKNYTINLDLPAEERWLTVAVDHAPAIANLVSELGQLIPEAFLKVFNSLKIDVAKVLPYPYGLELRGISRAVNVSEKELLLGNLVYELTAYNHTHGQGQKACTSIVSQMSDGTIVHGRNFDYSIASALRGLVIQVDFEENGQVVYTGTTFAGLVGLPSAQRPNKFTITVNQRNSGRLWMNALEALIAGSHGIAGLAVRDTVANPDFDFKMAVESLTDRPFISTLYLIMGGLKADEGVVITRDRSKAIDHRWLGTNNSWFLVQTNYDHWLSPPASDDRRDPAINGMMSVGKSTMSLSKVFGVLSIPPVLNAGIVFTNIMSASRPDQYKSWMRVLKN